MRGRESMKTISVVLTNELNDKIILMVDEEIFPNKSELIRAAIREYLNKQGYFSEN